MGMSFYLKMMSKHHALQSSVVQLRSLPSTAFAPALNYQKGVMEQTTHSVTQYSYSLVQNQQK